jgi:glycosyl transferase family 87
LSNYSSTIKQVWSESRVYRRVLTVVAIYAVLRLLLQVVLLSGVLFPDESAEASLPDDLRIYLEAAQHIQNGENLYPSLPLERMEFYQYSPAYALAFTPFLWVAPITAAFIHTFLHIIIYALLYLSWGRIFRRLNMPQANITLAWTLPVWLLFSSFWGDLGYLNIYILMALLATLLIDAILAEDLCASVLWLSLILQTKPQWVFAAALPLLLRNYRFFFRLLWLAAASYVGIAALTMAFVGVDYGWSQYSHYFRLLTGISAQYPWRGPEMPFLGYNHSIMQIAVYALGATPNVIRLATLVKVAILLPLGLVGLRFLRQPARTAQARLDLAFALYLAAFIWLDVVWELSLGIAVFTYLLATYSNRNARFAILGVFLLYALIDFWQILSFLVLGPDVVVPGPYILTDPSIYLPIIMIVTLVFYAMLVRRLWVSFAPAIQPENQQLPENSPVWTQS